MSELVERISDVCKTVIKLYYAETDENRRREFLKRYNILSEKLEIAVHNDFKKNENNYSEAIKKIKDFNKQLEKLKNDNEKSLENFTLFIEMFENIDTLLSAIFPKFAPNQ